jgi:hypothetical protein
VDCLIVHMVSAGSMLPPGVALRRTVSDHGALASAAVAGMGVRGSSPPPAANVPNMATTKSIVARRHMRFG